MLLLWSVSHKHPKIVKNCTKKHLKKTMGMEIIFWKRIPFGIILEFVSFLKDIILQYISKYSLCQYLIFQKEKKLNWKKLYSQAFFEGLIPEKILWTVIFLFISRFWHMMALNIRIYEFSYPGLQNLHLGFKTTYFH